MYFRAIQRLLRRWGTRADTANARHIQSLLRMREPVKTRIILWLQVSLSGEERQCQPLLFWLKILHVSSGETIELERQCITPNPLDLNFSAFKVATETSSYRDVYYRPPPLPKSKRKREAMWEGWRHFVLSIRIITLGLTYLGLPCHKQVTHQIRLMNTIITKLLLLPSARTN